MTDARRVLAAALVVLGGIAAATGVAAWRADGDVRVTPVRLSRSPGVVVRPAAGVRAPEAGGVALLVHGFGCNRSMMMPLAKHLARRGVASYALDLPGHGASPLRFDPEAAQAEVRAALGEIGARERLRPEQVIVVGHSYGAALLAQVAPRARAAAFLGPSYLGGLSTGAPRALLVLTAEHDHRWILAATRQMREDVERDAAPDTERAWRVAPGTGHVGLVFDAGVHRELARFVDRVREPGPAPDAPPRGGALLAQVAAASAIGAALAAALLAAAWLRARIGAPPPVLPRAPALRTALVLAYAAIAAIGACSRWGAAGSLRLVEGDGLASLLVGAGIAGVVLDAALCRGAHLPRRRDLWGVPVGLLPFSAVYAAAAVTVDGRLYTTALQRPQLALAGALLVGLLPFFAVTEGVLAGSVGRVSRVAAPLAVFALYGALALAAPFVFGAPRLVRFVPTALGVGAAAIGAGAAIRAVTGAWTASSVFSAACAAWALAVGFARS